MFTITWNLVSGIIKDNNCQISFFDTDEDLQKLASSACLHHLVQDRCNEIDTE